MAYTTVRISEDMRATLRQIATAEGVPMRAVLARALESYRRQRILERINQAYATLRRDDFAWADLVRERADWEGTLLDGLPHEPKPVDAQPRTRRRRRS